LDENFSRLVVNV